MNIMIVIYIIIRCWCLNFRWRESSNPTRRMHEVRCAFEKAMDIRWFPWEIYGKSMGNLWKIYGNFGMFNDFHGFSRAMVAYWRVLSTCFHPVSWWCQLGFQPRTSLLALHHWDPVVWIWTWQIWATNVKILVHMNIQLITTQNTPPITCLITWIVCVISAKYPLWQAMK